MGNLHFPHRGRFGVSVALLCKGQTLGHSCDQLCVFASAEGEYRLTTRIFVLGYFFSIMERLLINLLNAELL